MANQALTVAQVAQRYGVGMHTVLGWIKAGQLRAVNVARKPGSKRPRWRITTDALATFEALRTATAPVPKAQRRRQPAGIMEFY